MRVAKDAEDDDVEEIDGLKASQRPTGGFVIDVWGGYEDKDPSLLIQGGTNGYSLDMWWGEEDNRHHCNNWVKFGTGTSINYPHDNDHDRESEINGYHDTETPTIEIHDPDPRAENVGYGGAEISVSPVEEGYFVQLTWDDEWEEKQEYSVIVPFKDPRKEDQREDYYEFVEPVVDTTRGGDEESS